MIINNFVEELWYGKHPLSMFLLPLSWVFLCLVMLRQYAYQTGLFLIKHAPVPVIVVGNLNVGGTGKTPLVIWLAHYLGDKGLKPGVVCRGYRGKAKKWPQQVREDSDPMIVGDEPVIIAKHTNVPVAAGPDRFAAIQGLVEHLHCNIIICDDGLQHYQLARDLEIAVVDGVRRFGNKRCLPAGPLREPVSRLKLVDLVVSNGLPGKGEHQMTFNIQKTLVSVIDKKQHKDIELFKLEKVHAIAGIGNPRRFFQNLRKMGLNIIEHVYPDHHYFKPGDILFNDKLPVVMTEKDAVKCRLFAHENCWYLPIEVHMTDTFRHRLDNLLEQVLNG